MERGVVKLEQLLQRPDIWQANRPIQQDDRQCISSGYTELDQALSGGWPRVGLMELLVPQQGIGELSLLLPALSSLSQAGHWLAWVQPPWVPCAVAVQNAGVDLSRLLIVKTEKAADCLWAMEQILRSGIFAGVLGWPQVLSTKAQRRLQLAAEAGGCWGTVFSRRPAGAAMSVLRLQLLANAQHLSVKILKARGSWSSKSISLSRHVVDSALFSPFGS